MAVLHCRHPEEGEGRRGERGRGGARVKIGFKVATGVLTVLTELAKAVNYKSMQYTWMTDCLSFSSCTPPPGPRYVVQIGDKVVDYNEDFRLFLATRNPAPFIPPDAISVVTEVNFTTTRAGLRGQVTHACIYTHTWMYIYSNVICNHMCIHR